MRFPYQFQAESRPSNCNKLDQVKHMSNSKGFTLVELMISVAMTGIILAAVYSVYTLQQKTYTVQDQVVEMQQNIRAATLTMVPEFRMAGFNPTGIDPAASDFPTFEKAEPDMVYFTTDLNEDGNVSLGNDDKSEHIAFDHYINADGISVLGMTRKDSAITLNDMGGGHFEATGHQPIAENIEAIEFLYTLEDGTQTTSTTDFPNIRSVTISILARAVWRDAKFVNDTVYTSASGIEWNITAPATPTNDNFRRRLLITTVQCRNMGL